MKNIIIVSKQNTAVAVGDNLQAPITKSCASAFVANLTVVNEILASIPTTPCETVHIYVPDLIQGIVSGSAVEYVKTGKTGSGNTLGEEELAGFKEFYKLYAERILNVRFSQFKYIAKDNAELQALKSKAWNVLNNTPVNTTVSTQTVDPDKAIREAIDAQIIKALEVGDMEMFTVLKAERDKLKQPEVVAIQNTSTVGANSNTVYVDFDDADTAFGEAGNNEKDMPIAFDEGSATIPVEW